MHAILCKRMKKHVEQELNMGKFGIRILRLRVDMQFKVVWENLAHLS